MIVIFKKNPSHCITLVRYSWLAEFSSSELLFYFLFHCIYCWCKNQVKSKSFRYQYCHQRQINVFSPSLKRHKSFFKDCVIILEYKTLFRQIGTMCPHQRLCLLSFHFSPPICREFLFSSSSNASKYLCIVIKNCGTFSSQMGQNNYW